MFHAKKCNYCFRIKLTLAWLSYMHNSVYGASENLFRLLAACVGQTDHKLTKKGRKLLARIWVSWSIGWKEWGKNMHSLRSARWSRAKARNKGNIKWYAAAVTMQESELVGITPRALASCGTGWNPETGHEVTWKDRPDRSTDWAEECWRVCGECVVLEGNGANPIHWRADRTDRSTRFVAWALWCVFRWVLIRQRAPSLAINWEMIEAFRCCIHSLRSFPIVAARHKLNNNDPRPGMVGLETDRYWLRMLMAKNYLS